MDEAPFYEPLQLNIWFLDSVEMGFFK